MGNQLQLTANLVAGPATVSDNQFPSGVTNLAFGLNPGQKPFNVDAGAVITVNSPSPAYFTVTAIGATGAVAQVTTFFARNQTPMILRLTFADPNGGADLVVTEPLHGAKLSEYPTNGYLKKLEVQGSGQFEFYAAGLQ